jgi:hypothetical protein
MFRHFNAAFAVCKSGNAEARRFQLKGEPKQRQTYAMEEIVLAADK